MRYFIALFLLSISTFSSGQTELLDAKKLWARDSIRLGTNWIRSISKDTALLTVTDRDIPSAKAVKDFVLNRWNNGLLPWDNVTSKPSLLISGNNLADVSNVATARTNLSVYSIATVNDSLLNHFTKSQADARFKSIDWFPSVANVTGLPDSLTNLQARIQTKLTKTDADTYYPAIQRMQDSLAAVQARVQTKEPFISSGTTSQYWRGDKAWQTLDKSAVGLSAVPNVDATNPVNISQSATYRFVTDSEKSTWNAKQNALGYTAENAANKATDFTTVNNTLYPTVQAVSNAISTATSSYIPLSQKGANNGVATLDVGGKVPFSQLPAALMIYKGTWNVSTNTPTLSDGTGVSGWVYIVSVGGTVNTGSGNITYSAGDYAIHNGSTWEKSAGTNNVASVNGQQGVVNLTTANISESGNLYYTDARVRAALSFTPGSGAYNSSTGVITIPTNTNQLTNGAGFITGFIETDPTIYAWAKAATKPSYSYSEISSTPTTWAWANITGIPSTFTPSAHSHGNADITDVAWAKITGAPAFITGNQTITLSGDISGSGTTAITTTIGALKVTNAMLAGSIDYSKMNSATVPTWNQSTTGNAATATLSSNSTLWNGLAIALATYSSGTVPSALIYNSTNNRVEFGTWAQYQTWLGLGSYAYRSSGLAELSGANFTGSLTGTRISLSDAGTSDYINRTIATSGAGSNNILIAGKSGVSNGFTVVYNGSAMAYSMAGGNLSVDGNVTANNFTLGGRGASFIYGMPDWRIYNTSGNGLVINNYSIDALAFSNTGAATFNNTITAGGTVTASNLYSAGNLSVGSSNLTAATAYIQSNSSSIPVMRVQSTSTEDLWNGRNSSGTITSTITSGGAATYASSLQVFDYIQTPTAFFLAPTGTGGWDRAYKFKGMSGTDRGGLGAFGADNALDYWYIGQDYTNYKVRFNNSSGSVGIGSAGSNAKLEVVATTGEVFRADAASGAPRIVANQSMVYLGGNVGVGTFNPDFSSSGYRVLTLSGSSTRSALWLSNSSTGTTGVAGSVVGYNGTTYLAGFDINADGATNSGNFKFYTSNAGSPSLALTIASNQAITATSTFTAASLIRSGGTSSQFLKADGSVDANTYATTASLSSYATTASLSGYVDMSSNQYEIGGNKTFLADVVVNGKLTGSRILAATASYTTTATISSTITTAFCSGSSYTLTLPSASGVTGQILTVISNSNLTGITLSGVEGGSYTLICNSSLVLVSNGTTWKIASVYQNSGACS